MSLIYFDNVTGSDFSEGERNPIAYLSTPPAVGDRVSMGAERLWQVLAVDRYVCSGEALYVAHCALIPIPREDWWTVAMSRDRSCYSLQLHIGGDQLIHTGHHMRGVAPQVGYLLPQFNVKEHTVTSQPWGVEAVHTYHLAEEINYPVYRVIHVCDCVFVPEVVAAEKEEMAIA